MKILLTGSTGYLGSRVAVRLQESGVAWEPLAVRLGDIAPASLACDAVIHCAGALRNRPEQHAAVNAEGTARLMSGLMRPARVIFVSSRSVYALGERDIPLGAPTDPFDSYGESKLAAEEAIRSAGFPHVIVRSCGIFGHPERSGIFPDYALDRVMRGEVLKLSSADPEVDYMSVDWLAELLVSAAMATDGESRVMHAMGPRRRISAMVRAMGDALRSAGRAEPVVERVDMPETGYPFMEPGGIPADWRVPPHPGDAEIFAAMILGRAQRS